MTLHPLTRCVVASGGRVSLASGRCAIVPTPKGTPPSFLAYRIGHCAHRLRSLWQVARIPVCEPGRAAHLRVPTRSTDAGQHLATPRFRGYLSRYVSILLSNGTVRSISLSSSPSNSMKRPDHCGCARVGCRWSGQHCPFRRTTTTANMVRDSSIQCTGP